MKAKMTLKIFVLLITTITIGSCDGITNGLAVPLKITPDPIPFTFTNSSVNDKGDHILIDEILNLGIAKDLDEHNYLFENVRELTIDNAYLKLDPEVESNSTVALNDFKDLKVYIGNQNNKVSEVKSIDLDEEIIYLDINREEILKYIDNDKVRVIITNGTAIKQETSFLFYLKFTAKIGV